MLQVQLIIQLNFGKKKLNSDKINLLLDKYKTAFEFIEVFIDLIFEKKFLSLFHNILVKKTQENQNNIDRYEMGLKVLDFAEKKISEI